MSSLINSPMRPDAGSTGTGVQLGTAPAARVGASAAETGVCGFNSLCLGTTTSGRSLPNGGVASVLAIVGAGSVERSPRCWLKSPSPVRSRYRKVKHLQENIESAELVLTTDDLEEMDRALAELKVHGGRERATDERCGAMRKAIKE